VSPRPADSFSYSYLLGLYLGDGHLAGNGRSWQLVISLDGRYKAIVDECRAAMLSRCRGADRACGLVRAMAASALRRWPRRGTSCFPSMALLDEFVGPKR
jgi:hypothetical protein